MDDDDINTPLGIGRVPGDAAEQEMVIAVFSDMLRQATADGARKRAAGEKPHWTIDEGHFDAMYRHLFRWERGENIDLDSGAHPLVHVAWRALAIAWQEQAKPSWQETHAPVS